MPRVNAKPAVETANVNLVEYMIVLSKHGRRLKTVCTAKHREGKVCNRCLAAQKAIWRGWWPKDEVGDLRGDLRLQRKAFRNARRRWKTLLNRMNWKRPRVAPHFLAYFEAEVKKHIAAEPVFVFQPREVFTREVA